MELTFESRIELTRIEGRIRTIQQMPELSPEPVLLPDGNADGNRVQVGTVLKDGGRYRMWYLAFPDTGEAKAKYLVAHAESDDGLTWRRTPLDLVAGVPFANNYIDMGIKSVFIDPHAPASHRYRGVGYLRYLRQTWAGSGVDPKGTGSSFYTAHSPDGLHWEVDSPTARWFSGDTVQCAYHPGRNCGLATVKFVRRANGISRRAIWLAECRDGQWGAAVCALMPDTADDAAALARGFVSTDYYELALLPAAQSTVGFLNNFRHLPPLSQSPANYAIFGTSDISLVFQAHPGDQWLHVPSRQSFVSCGDAAWNAGWTGPSTMPVEIGDHHVLYLTGAELSHAWDMDVDWSMNEKWAAVREEAGPRSVIGLARWPKWRLFGLQAEPEGWLDLELGPVAEPSELLLNYRTRPGGSVRVQLYNRAARGDLGEIPGRSAETDVVPLQGDSLGEVVRWQTGSVIEPQPGRCLAARIALDNAAVYAWELRPATG